MANIEINMPGESTFTPEVSAQPNLQKNAKISDEELVKNASLSDADRPEAARTRLTELGLLNAPFGDEHKTALQEAHLVGKGQKGKNGQDASVGNYTFEQIKEKEKILLKAFTPEQAHILMREGYAGAAFPITNHPELAERYHKAPPDSFMEAEVWYEHLMRIPIRRQPATLQVELRRQRIEAREDLMRLRAELEQEPKGEEIIENMREEGLVFYNKVRSTPTEQEYGADKQQVIEGEKSNLRTKLDRLIYESIWDDSPELQEMIDLYGGLLDYTFLGVVQEVDKAENHRSGDSLNPFAEEEFRIIRERRERMRIREKKYKQEENHYGGVIYRFTAENPGEFPDAVSDFVKDRVFTLADSDPEGINEELNKIRHDAGTYLDQNRTRLEKEGQIVEETNPYFLRAKAMADALPDLLGNERMLYKGGDEHTPNYKKRFASNYIAHHNAVYLENPKVALIAHLIGTVKGGTYWFGHGWDVEKAEAGEIADYRVEIAEEIVEFAATHELFLSEKAFKYREGDNPEKRDLRYSFDDNIERLLIDPDGSVWTDMEASLRARGANQQEIDEALQRHDTRVALFRSIKERNDVQQGLGGLTPDQRKVQLSRRIVEKMRLKTKDSFLTRFSEESLAKLDNAELVQDWDLYDKIIWKWIEDYNKYRIKLRLPKWHPSAWDRIRCNIDRPTKVLDRSLSENQLMDMFDSNDLLFIDPSTLNKREKIEHQKDIDYKLEEARFGFMLARSMQVFHYQDVLLGGVRARLIDPTTGQYIGKLYGDDEETKRVNQALGLTDAAGNVIDPKRKVFRVWDVIQARLQIAIEDEATVINDARANYQNAAPADKAAMKAILDDLILNAQFAATHAFNELGMVEGKLPVWSHNFLDASSIDAFAKVMAAWGVNVGTGNIEMTHNSKNVFYEMMERGRRALKSESDRAATEFMSGLYPVFERDSQGKGVPWVDPQGRPLKAVGLGPDDYIAVVDPQTGNIIPVSGPQGDNLQDPQGRDYILAKPSVNLYDADNAYGDMNRPINERYRITSKGGVKGNRQLMDPRHETSTSGGVVFTEAIPQIGDIGFYSMLQWLGVTDLRQLQGNIARRDEQEAHHHRFFDVLDPVHHADSQGAAYGARKALLGGEWEKGKSGPGFFLEPYHGAFKSADWVYKFSDKARHLALPHTVNYVSLMQLFRESEMSYKEFRDNFEGEILGLDRNGNSQKVKAEKGAIEELRQMSYLDLDKINKLDQDDLYQTMYGILDYFQDYLKSTKAVESSRIGRAPRNWEYNNTLKWFEFRRLMRQAMQGSNPDRGFVLRHGYSPEVTSEIAIRMMETALFDADYLILRSYEIKRLASEGAEILVKALTPEQISNGYVIPWNQKKWKNLPDPLRTALETIRRRGLLEFMREDGYKVGNKQILGQKIPPMVQREMFANNGNLRRSW